MSVSRWIDTHIHVSNYGPGGVEREDILDDLLELLDRSGVDLRFIISCDGPWTSRMMQDADQVLEANRFIYDLVRRAPERLYGSCTVNPNFPEQSLEVMRICFEKWGFVQLGEMLQYMMKYDMDSDAVEEEVRLAVQLDVPVQVHISTSNRGEHPSSFGMEQLADLFEAVERVPEAKYILAHAVGMPDDNPPVVDQYLDAIEDRYGEFPGNFWVEIRDFSSPGVRSVMDRVPSTQLLAGTDWTTRVGPPFQPYGTIFGTTPDENPYPPSIEAMVEFLSEAGANEADIEGIVFQNAASLYRL